jgi:hypothetical protein
LLLTGKLQGPSLHFVTLKTTTLSSGAGWRGGFILENPGFRPLPECTKLYAMTRAELLRAVIRQAKSNGFEFRKWYSTRMTQPWTSFEMAIQCLSEERRYYALLFAHEFAQAFWRTGSKMTFVVPNNRFTRISKDGSTMVVERKGHTRRTVLPDVWRYHLKEMAVADDPLRYIRKFLLIEEDMAGIQPISDDGEATPPVNGFSGGERRKGDRRHNDRRQNVGS